MTNPAVQAALDAAEKHDWGTRISDLSMQAALNAAFPIMLREWADDNARRNPTNTGIMCSNVMHSIADSYSQP